MFLVRAEHILIRVQACTDMYSRKSASNYTKQTS